MAKKYSQPSPAQLAAEERNRKIQERKLHVARRKNALRTMLTAVSPLVLAWYFGTNGGGVESQYTFIPLHEIPKNKFSALSKRSLKIRDLSNELIIQHIMPEQTYQKLSTIDYSAKVIERTEDLIFNYLPQWCSYDALRIQTGVYAACLVDWLELEIREEDYIDEDSSLYKFIKQLAKFSEMTIDQKDDRMREALTKVYWAAWTHIFGLEDYSQHPNKYRNLKIPHLAEVSGHYEDGREYTGYAIEFDEELILDLTVYVAENKPRYEKELEEKQSLLKETNRKFTKPAQPKHYTLPIFGTAIKGGGNDKILPVLR